MSVVVGCVSLSCSLAFLNLTWIPVVLGWFPSHGQTGNPAASVLLHHHFHHSALKVIGDLCWASQSYVVPADPVPQPGSWAESSRRLLKQPPFSLSASWAIPSFSYSLLQIIPSLVVSNCDLYLLNWMRLEHCLGSFQYQLIIELSLSVSCAVEHQWPRGPQNPPQLTKL